MDARMEGHKPRRKAGEEEVGRLERLLGKEREELEAEWRKTLELRKTVRSLEGRVDELKPAPPTPVARASPQTPIARVVPPTPPPTNSVSNQTAPLPGPETPRASLAPPELPLPTCTYTEATPKASYAPRKRETGKQSPRPLAPKQSSIPITLLLLSRSFCTTLPLNTNRV